VSKSRVIPNSISASGIIYESNSIEESNFSDQKSEYSYPQYHWWALTFNVTEVFTKSSVI